MQVRKGWAEGTYSKEQESLINDFVKKRVASDYPIARKRDSRLTVEKFSKDIFNGVAGEFVAYDIFTGLGFTCSQPDLKIYNKHEKSFLPDLLVDNVFKVNIKSVDHRAIKFPWSSWLIQYGKDGHDAEMLTPGNDVFVGLIRMDTKNRRGFLVGLPKCSLLIERKLVQDPIRVDLRNSKRAIYYKDIKEMKEGDRWSLGIPEARQNWLNKYAQQCSRS